MADLTHFDDKGNARMVNVSEKSPTERMARASCSVSLQPATLQAIREGRIGKGDVLQVARLAGIMAAKQTPNLIPLCHVIALSSVEIEFDTSGDRVHIESSVQAVDRTGAEMEALVAVATAALTIYDMCKSIDRGMTIEHVRLEEKSGGKSGHFVREASSDDQSKA